MGHTSWDFGTRVRWLRASRRLPMLSQSTKAVSLASQRIFFISPLREHWSFSSASQGNYQRNCEQKILCEQPASDAKCKHLTPAANCSCKWFAVHIISTQFCQFCRPSKCTPWSSGSWTTKLLRTGPFHTSLTIDSASLPLYWRRWLHLLGFWSCPGNKVRWV